MSVKPIKQSRVQKWEIRALNLCVQFTEAYWEPRRLWYLWWSFFCVNSWKLNSSRQGSRCAPGMYSRWPQKYKSDISEYGSVLCIVSFKHLFVSPVFLFLNVNVEIERGNVEMLGFIIQVQSMFYFMDSFRTSRHDFFVTNHWKIWESIQFKEFYDLNILVADNPVFCYTNKTK